MPEIISKVTPKVTSETMPDAKLEIVNKLDNKKLIQLLKTCA